MSKIAVCGSSLGGFYAARAACYEHRLAAAISHGAIWSVQEVMGGSNENHGLASHFKWVFGADTMKEVYGKAAPFTLEGHLEKMRCPYLILHGGHDVLAVSQARKVYEYGKSHGVDVALRLLSAEETGAEHCQHDNPTIGQEVIGDWLADRFNIDQRALIRQTHIA
jgi:acetyl esterase/lipase